MPKRILLADDSITIQKVVELTFSDGDYEVTAVNNGAKAIQKLSEMKPDIVLSDIIMPEKNGYEVCEYVKSHPELRHLPVILLTGTFEPFDPDRAEKAGCDAVVTKPFESQSLIQRVEELIAQSQPSAQGAPAAEPEPEVAPSPWEDDVTSEENASSPASASEPASASDSSEAQRFTHDSDIFNAPLPSEEQAMPFDSPADDSPFAPPPGDSGETRALPRMTFDDLQQMGAAPTASENAPPAEGLPWDEPPAPAFSTEAPSFPEMRSDNEQVQASESQDAPFGAPPPAEDFSGETRAFPRMTFDEMQQMANQTQPSAPPPDEIPPPPAWNEPEAPAYGGETRAFPKMTFDELAGGAQPVEPAPAPWLEQSDSPAFNEMPAFNEAAPSEPARESEPEPLPWDTTPTWSPTAEGTTEDFSTAAPPVGEPTPEDVPFAPPAAQQQDIAEAEEPSWSSAAAASAEAESSEPAIPQTVMAPEPAALQSAAEPGELTDAQVDRIARRVVELMSEQVVRNIAWEVIPDLAEMVVKERIRQLESDS